MKEEPDIPFPIRFNVFKHHRNYIIEKLKEASSDPILDLPDSICNNYIDIYTGTMTPGEIGNGVIAVLKANAAFLKDDFIGWVHKNKGFQQIKLDDQSEWIVRISEESERYIHLHPARTGFHTIRFKGSTLKTVYKLKTNFGDRPEPFTMDQVNLIRRQIGLSPIKRLERNKGILNCFERFFNQDC